MKTLARRIITLIILGAMLAVALSMSIYSEDDKEVQKDRPYRDVVLVLDCSGSMLNADPYKLCATACKLLVDQIPLENARIAIIAYGYNGGSAYNLQNYTVDNPTELNLINVVTPLQETASLSGIDDLKKTIDIITEKRGNATPTGTALLCAADLLENAGSAGDSACIVLIGDGECTSNINVTHDVRNVETAVQSISSHNWPVFALQVNSNNTHDESSRQTQRMKHIAYDCGNVSPGYKNEDYCYFNLTSFEQGDIAVSEAASNIFAWVANSFPPPEPVKYELPTDITYEVPNLASEFNITLLGEGLRDITITYPNGEAESIDGNFEERNLLTSIIEGRYYNIKLFCPMEGQYTVHVGGDKGKVAVSLDVGTMDTGLKLESNPTLGQDKILKDKGTNIHFTSSFYYRDTDIFDNHCYEDIPAVLEIEGTSGKTEIPMTGNKASGYSADIVVNELSSYGPAFTIRAVVKDEAFVDGCKYSNPVQFKLDNVPLALIDPNIPDTRVGANKTLEIDLTKHFENPDNDKLDVVLECLNDGNKQFEFTCEDDILKIESGTDLGDYEVKLKVKDYDMAKYLESNPFVLTIFEEPFVFEEIEPVEVWVDALPKFLQFLQEPGPEEVTLNLADSYYDPDGVPAQYSDISFEGEGTIFNCKQDGSTFVFMPIEKGKGTVSLTVSDGFNTQTVSFNVKVVSGWSQFWSENWIWFALGSATILLILFVLMLLSKNTRMKGKWNVTFSISNGGMQTVLDPIDFSLLSCNKKKKVTLQTLIDEMKDCYMKGTANVAEMVAEKFGDDAQEIILKGVLGADGFAISKLPKKVSNDCKVYYNGSETRNKTTALGGTVRFEHAETEYGTSKTYAVELTKASE